VTTSSVNRSYALQPGQPLPGGLDVGQRGGGVLPEVEELMAVRDPEKEGKGPHLDPEDEGGVEPLGHA